MLDADLAELYDVDTKVLNQAVRRNLDRFPPDFAFQLTQAEFETLRSQFVTSKGRGGRRYLPYVFTEYGVAMLSSVLNSKQAIYVNIEIMRVFGRLRQLLASHADLLRDSTRWRRNTTVNFASCSRQSASSWNGPRKTQSPGSVSIPRENRFAGGSSIRPSTGPVSGNHKRDRPIPHVSQRMSLPETVFSLSN